MCSIETLGINPPIPSSSNIYLLQIKIHPHHIPIMFILPSVSVKNCNCIVNCKIHACRVVQMLSAWSPPLAVIASCFFHHIVLLSVAPLQPDCCIYSWVVWTVHHILPALGVFCMSNLTVQNNYNCCICSDGCSGVKDPVFPSDLRCIESVTSHSGIHQETNVPIPDLTPVQADPHPLQNASNAWSQPVSQRMLLE